MIRNERFARKVAKILNIFLQKIENQKFGIYFLRVTMSATGTQSYTTPHAKLSDQKINKSLARTTLGYSAPQCQCRPRAALELCYTAGGAWNRQNFKCRTLSHRLRKAANHLGDGANGHLSTFWAGRNSPLCPNYNIMDVVFTQNAVACIYKVTMLRNGENSAAADRGRCETSFAGSLKILPYS